MQPQFGSKLKKIVFENSSLRTQDAIDSTIRDAISKQLPYVIVEDVIVEDNPDDNKVNISLEFTTTIQPDVFDTLTFNFNIGDN